MLSAGCRVRPERAGLLALAVLAIASNARAQGPCDTRPNGASRDLYCIELLPGPAGDSVTGTAQLDWDGGPFTQDSTKHISVWRKPA